VVLEPAPKDPRLLFGAARAAAEAGVVPGLDYGRARASLKETGAVIAAGVPRDRARALISYLAIEGFGAAARTAPTPPRAARGGSRTRLAAAAAVLVAVLAAALGAFLFLRARAPAPPRGEAAAAGEPAAPGASPEPRPPEAAAERAASALTTAELARLAQPALAVLTCRGKLGSGFFVAKDKVLTNAHVTCGPGTSLDVKLGGGRQLIGRVRSLDVWLDFAVVEVPGADVASPLALGDSTALSPGDPVVLLGSPLGLEATVHDGKVSFVGRNLEGVAHLQVNADVNPGNSGGPLLDGRGRAVGIVTLKAEDATGVGFALPVEYAREALGLPASDAARERWEATGARIRQEDDTEAARLVSRLERPLPLSAAAAGDRLALVVMQRFPRGTAPVAVVAEVRDGEKLLCESRGEVSDWVPVEQRFKEAAEHDRAGRRVRWMVRRGISTDAYAGAAELDVSSCPAGTGDAATVSIRGAGDEVVAFPARALEAGRRMVEARGVRAARLEADDAARSEAAWRQAFREARERIASLEARRRALLVRDARRELPSVEVELAAAREALDELERRASFQAIPREWRR
jgi:serine protease Do